MNIPQWKIVVFQQRERPDSQNFNNDTFHKLLVTSAQCYIGTEYIPDSGTLLNCDDDEYS